MSRAARLLAIAALAMVLEHRFAGNFIAQGAASAAALEYHAQGYSPYVSVRFVCLAGAGQSVPIPGFGEAGFRTC